MSDRAARRVLRRPLPMPATDSSGKQIHAVMYCARGEPEPRFCILGSSLLPKAKARLFRCCLGWSDCMSLGRPSGGSGSEIYATAMRSEGSLRADPPTRRWVRSSCKRIIATPSFFAWDRISRWGDRLGSTHIIRGKQILPGSWERGIVTTRRFFCGKSPWAESLPARPEGHAPKDMSAIRDSGRKFAIVLADSRKS